MTRSRFSPRGQIEIDIGPFAALLGQETLKEQLHADWIDGCNAERIADGAVGGGPAALHQNSFVAAKIHDVPDDQKISGELELSDDIELLFDLRTGAFIARLIADARGFARAIAQEVDFGLAVRHGITRKFIAQIRELEW